MTRTRIFSAMALLACAGATASGSFQTSSLAPSSKILSDYIEVRTAAVFAGACHFNGELVTTGDDAVMAWNFQAGAWNGVNLAGVRAMAAVTSNANLSDSSGTRRTQLVIDTAATPAQVRAIADLIKTRESEQLGAIVSVIRAPIAFSDSARHYEVAVDGFASMSVDPMPNDECCKQPNDVWYSPLNPVPNRKVGFTQTVAYQGPAGSTPWERNEENSAFYGQCEF